VLPYYTNIYVWWSQSCYYPVSFCKICVIAVWNKIPRLKNQIKQPVSLGWIIKKTIQAVNLPRCIFHSLASSHTIRLHMLSGASEICCGAMGYLRLGWTSGINSCGFVFWEIPRHSKKNEIYPEIRTCCSHSID
jgi:hypothetical protein